MEVVNGHQISTSSLKLFDLTRALVGVYYPDQDSLKQLVNSDKDEQINTIFVMRDEKTDKVTLL